jgi:hypothetical protein
MRLGRTSKMVTLFGQSISICRLMFLNDCFWAMNCRVRVGRMTGSIG